MDWAYSEIRRIQQAARAGKRIAEPRWPMIIMRTPKGMDRPQELDGEPIEGSYRAHQVPITDAKTNAESLRLVEEWLRSYRPRRAVRRRRGAPPRHPGLVPDGRPAHGQQPAHLRRAHAPAPRPARHQRLRRAGALAATAP